MQISNVTFDEIATGDTATYTRLITNQEVEAFAAISGDHNPLHLDPEYAATCLLYTSPSPRDGLLSRMPSSA